jgi:hypothetical protein
LDKAQVRKAVKDTEVNGSALSGYLLPPHRRYGPTSSKLPLPPPTNLQRPSKPRTTQEAKLFKIIDCLSYPSLRHQLGKYNSTFLKLFPQQPGQKRINWKMFFSPTINVRCFFF